jgi:glycosyltransferase involved in cell wall biosynthesis
MRIVFFSDRISFEADSLETRGLGGSESAGLNMAFSLKKNFPEDEIIVYNNNSGKYKEYNGVIFKSIIDFYNEVKTFNADVLISIREPRIFKLPYIDSKLKILWSQDICNESDLIWLKEEKYCKENIDIIFANSKFSHDNIKEHFPNSDIRILRNGFNSEWLSDNIKKENIAVYTSTPFRGLNLLADYWVEIYQKCRKYYDIDPKLKIFGGMDLYNQSNNYFKDLYNKLSNLPNVEVFGSVCQRSLYYHLNSAKVMLYPCNYLETSCMSVLEAISNKLWTVTTDIGALGEQVIDDYNGNLIKFTNQQEYKELFVQSSIDSFMNSEKIKEIPNTVYSLDNQSKFLRSVIREKL